MQALVTAGAGFLLAVLWFDLMFDVQARGDTEVPAEACRSISAYYRRVTTEARPMNRLVAFAMVFTLGSIVAELATSTGPAWARWGSLSLALAPIGLAGARTVPRAVRLGAATDSQKDQSAMARAILREHLFCFSAIALLLVVQLSMI